MSEITVKVEDLTKIYKLYNKPTDRIKEALNIGKKQHYQEHYALDNVNFELHKGDILGIVGTNGSGKSTLLKIITGVLSPTSGNVQINGNISALLELGAGFNPEYTGIENIYLHGTMMGRSREQVEQDIDKIIEFADIGEFIRQPVKTYSSGMFVRLAFAVATNIAPDILVVDEALSVGDINFQMRSINKIKELIKKGTSVLFVSHDIMTVKSLCNKGIYIDKGRVIKFGESGEVCDLYLADQNNKNSMFGNSMPKKNCEQTNHLNNNINSTDECINLEFKKQADKIRVGSGKARVTNIIVENIDGRCTNEFYYKEKINVKVYFNVEQNIDSLVIALYIRDRNQLELIGTNSLYEGIEIKNLKKGRIHEVEFRFINYLEEGEYGISTILADNIPTSEFYDQVDNVIIINSYDLKNQKRWAKVGIPMEVNYRKVDMS